MIKVKHAPSAAAIGESAYTIGRGERRERDIHFAAEVGLRQASLSLQARGQGIQAERSRQQLALQKEELGFRKEQWEDEPARQLERGLQQQKLLQSKISWQYDEGQKREMAKVTMGVAWLRDQVASGKWTAEQAEQAEQQLWRKYYSIIPLPVYDDSATPQERWDSGIVKASTGAQYRMNEKGGFDPMGPSVLDRAKIYTSILTALTTTDPMTGKITTDTDAVLQEYNKFMTLLTKEDELATRLEEIQKRRAQRGPQLSLEQEAQREAAVEALPVMFENISKGQPKIGRKKKGPPSLFADDVYGEEAYNKMRIEAVERGKREGLPPDVVLAEFDEWWDIQYDKHRGKATQTFGNRMEFKGAEPESQEEFIRTIQSIEDKTQAKAYYDKWVGKWR